MIIRARIHSMRSIFLSDIYTAILLVTCMVGQVFGVTHTGGRDMKLTSTAFIDNGILPSKYTCDGENISPPIRWQDVPTGTKSFALIYDDPDAPGGTWTHWVLYNIPATTYSLSENVSVLPEGTKVGINSWPEAKYGAPCPPRGEHRYIFHLYALDIELKLDGDVTSERLRHAIEGHILASATLTGRYTRRNK